MYELWGKNQSAKNYWSMFIYLSRFRHAVLHKLLKSSLLLFIVCLNVFRRLAVNQSRERVRRLVRTLMYFAKVT